MIVQPLDSADQSQWLEWLARADAVHQHVGWHPTTHWLGRPASLWLRRADGSAAGSLLASPDGLGVAWVHLFASRRPPAVKAVWEALWPAARGALQAERIQSIWAMTTQTWMMGLLTGCGFSRFGEVIALARQPEECRAVPAWAGPVEPLAESDLARVLEVDQTAFQPPWQLDAAALRETFRRSVLATVLRVEGEIAAYQICLPTAHGVHLARLAVLPAFQNRGMGRALIGHLLGHFHRLGTPWITVNTQSDNPASLRVYRSTGFRDLGEAYPVFRLSRVDGR